ncbi:MAG: nitroreductase family protein, partial [Bacteroidales bacterium]|nr:nitroreductase family protein [Bacteroidales bacterium]
MSNTVIDALKNRRSIRKFKKVQITDEELKTVLEAGTWAPTAMGFQDPWIVAVQNPELMEKIAKLNAEVWGRDVNPFYGAPTYVLV